MKSGFKKTYTISYTEKPSIIFEEGLISHVDQVLRSENYSSFVILSDGHIAGLFAKKLENSINKLGKPIHTILIPSGEASKNLQTIEKIASDMISFGIDRNSTLLALGGGVIGDIATFAASVYYRGIDCVQIPTTLLSQVDSAIGGKGGVNYGIYKNTLGTIRQPRYVLIDPNLITHLPNDQIRSGMGEIVKYALALDASIFAILSHAKSANASLFKKIIPKCIDIKMAIVAKDPFERQTERMHLNFGHTVGHAVERQAKLPHGHAVAIGMVFALKVSNKTKMLSDEQYNSAIALIQKYHLPTTISGVKKNEIITIMHKDKKNKGGMIRLVLLSAIGKSQLSQGIDENIINQSLDEIIL